MCAYDCILLLLLIQHRTVLMLPLISRHTVEGEGDVSKKPQTGLTLQEHKQHTEQNVNQTHRTVGHQTSRSQSHCPQLHCIDAAGYGRPFLDPSSASSELIRQLIPHLLHCSSTHTRPLCLSSLTTKLINIFYSINYLFKESFILLNTETVHGRKNMFITVAITIKCIQQQHGI